MESDKSKNSTGNDFVLQLKLREPAAWEALVTYYREQLRDDIRAGLQSRGLSIELVSDVEQQMWLRALEKIGEFQYESDEKLYHWLRALGKYSIYNYRKWASNKRIVVPELEEALNRIEYHLGLYEDSPEVDLIAIDNEEERAEMILQALKELPRREQKIVTRYYLMNESRETIAENYGIQPDSVTKVLNRARKSIRTYVLANYLFDVSRMDKSSQNRA